MITPDEDDGAKVREPHYIEEDLDGNDKEDLHKMPGLAVFLTPRDQHDIAIQEFGEDSMYPTRVEIFEEDIPDVVEAIAKRVPESQRQEVLKRVRDELGDEKN